MNNRSSFKLYETKKLFNKISHSLNSRGWCEWKIPERERMKKGWNEWNFSHSRAMRLLKNSSVAAYERQREDAVTLPYYQLMNI